MKVLPENVLDRLTGGIIIPALLLLVISPAIFLSQLTHDAAWQMWIGRQMLHGGDLYSDFIEVNPPLWFWLAVPIEAVAGALQANSLAALIAMFLLAIVAAVFLVNRMIWEWPDRHRLLFLIAFVVAAVPFGNFGQREHFAFIATVPYVLLIGRRQSGQPTATGIAVLIGLLAAVGFALKPHFALVPILLELWLRRSLLRPETIALLLFATAYGACVLAFEPDYFTQALPLANRAYGQFGGFSPPMLLPSALLLLLAVFIPRSDRGSGSALLVASLAYYLVFVFQLKGFAYHVLPAMGFLALSMAAAIPSLPRPQAICALAIALFGLLPNLQPYRTDAWADVPNGASYAALSVAPRAGWPLVEERQLKWPLRSMSLWMAPALGTEIRASVVNDLRCHPPQYLLVDDSRSDFSAMFKEVVAHYSAINRNGHLTLMRLARPLPKGENCREIY